MKKRTGFQVATLKSPPPQSKEAEAKTTPTKAPSSSSSSSGSSSSSSSSETTARATKECKGDEVTSVPRPSPGKDATNETLEAPKCSTPDVAKEGDEDKSKAKSPAASSSSSGSSTTDNAKEEKGNADAEVQSEKKEPPMCQPEVTAAEATTAPTDDFKDKVECNVNEQDKLSELDEATKTLDALTSAPDAAGSVPSPIGSQRDSKKAVVDSSAGKPPSDKEEASSTRGIKQSIFGQITGALSFFTTAEAPKAASPEKVDQSPSTGEDDAAKPKDSVAAPAGEETAAPPAVEVPEAAPQKCDDAPIPVNDDEAAKAAKDADDEDDDYSGDAKTASAKKASKKGASSAKSRKRQGDAKPPRAPTSYIIFFNEIRESIKTKNPDMKPTEIIKAIGEQWRNLSKDEKKTYEEKSEAEKLRLGIDSIDSGKPTTSRKGTKKSAKASAKSNSKERPSLKRHSQSNSRANEQNLQDGFIGFCLENRGRVEEGLGEGATLADIQRELSKEWEQLGFEERRKHMVAANPSVEADVLTPTIKAVQLDQALAASISDGIVAGYKEGEKEDVEFVLAQTLEGDFVTKRKRLDYSDLDYEEAKKHKTGDDVSNAIALFKRRKHQFYAEIEQRTVNGVLDLDDISAGSMLETLAFLGNMREDVFPALNSKLQSPDVWMKVPTLGLCLVVQNLLDGERQHKAALAKELEEAKARIKELEGGKVGLSDAVRMEE